MPTTTADKISAQDIAEYANTLYSPAAKHALMKTIEKIVPDNIDEIAARYKTIKMPALIVWCEEDKVVPVAFWASGFTRTCAPSELAPFSAIAATCPRKKSRKTRRSHPSIPQA